MSKLLFSVLLLVLVAGAFYFFITTAPKAEPTLTPTPATGQNAEYFQERLITLGVQKVGQPIEGFDAFMLMQAFPGFIEADFDTVATFGGHYELKGKKIEFVRDQGKPISSADGTVSDTGYVTLLANVSARLAMRADSQDAIDRIIERLSDSNSGVGAENPVLVP